MLDVCGGIKPSLRFVRGASEKPPGMLGPSIKRGGQGGKQKEITGENTCFVVVCSNKMVSRLNQEVTVFSITSSNEDNIERYYYYYYTITSLLS